MKIFAIRDETDPARKDVAYLLYYEQSKRFYIELPDDADPWETPLLLSSFLKRGERTVNAYWSKLWVQQRIVPPDRQNLGQILKANHLESYDEFALLMLADGRCAQDNYYLVPISQSNITGKFYARFQKKVEDVVPLSNFHLLVFFRDGTIQKFDMKSAPFLGNAFLPILKDEALFSTVAIQPGGYGVCWGETLAVADTVLYDFSDTVALSQEDFARFAEYRVVNAAEAAGLLHCSRQNISDLVRRGRLHPVKATPKNTLFLKSEIIQRNWK
ncbi:MAG TPA: DUF2442 domain-containing protein [Candidatus Limiplasma sp.]|nr:DUF2442 domain-containing protein [Candidatus Limiplasma sp.]